MGIEMKTVSVKWDAETLHMAEDLQQWFSPLAVHGRSQMTRLLVKIVHQLILTNGIQAVVLNHLRSKHLEQRAGPAAKIEWEEAAAQKEIAGVARWLKKGLDALLGPPKEEGQQASEDRAARLRGELKEER